MRPDLRSVAVHMALAAMLLRALLPAGWMPASDLRHGTWLEICDGMAHGPGHVMADMGAMPDMPGMAHHAPSGPAHSAHEICPFAAAAHLATVGVGGTTAAPTRIGFAVRRDLRIAQAAPRPRLDTAAPRGPPLSV